MRIRSDGWEVLGLYGVPKRYRGKPEEDTGYNGVGTCERLRPWPAFYRMLGQTHMNGWSHVIASQNGGSTCYIFPLRLGVLQWSHHLFNYWKNKKTIIERFLILLI